MKIGIPPKAMMLALSVTLGLLLSTPAAADVRHGQELHTNNCVTCHTSMVGGDGSGLYTRADRRVTSQNQLVTQVNRCESTLGLNWFEEDVMAVVEYLNRNYYKF
jgi:cytochrome c2